MKIFIYIILFTSHFACMNVTNDVHWINPEINCSLKQNEDPVKQHPTINHSTTTAFNNFCERMRKGFAQSNMSKKEAEQIYSFLEKAKLITDQQSGMPSPNLPPLTSLKAEDLKKRVAIKKISEDVYEIYYFYRSCGTNYAHNRLTVANNEIEKVERIEAWSGVAPC